MLKRLLVPVVLSLLHLGSANSAEIWLAGAGTKKPLYAVIEGEIRPGDFKRFDQILREKGPLIARVYVYSPGGDVREAMKIGGLISRLYLPTNGPTPFYPPYANDDEPIARCEKPAPRVESNCVCYSSCFLVWIAGAKRGESLVGIHRPSFDRKFYASLGPDEAEKVYGKALQMMESYMSEYGVPQSLRELMRATPSRDIHKLVTPNTLNGHTPSFGELLGARCPLLTRLESGRLGVLYWKMKQSRASSAEAIEYEELKQRDGEAMLCEAREALKMRIDAFSRHYSIDYLSRIWGRR